ncbi:MAG: beta-lactamase family protein [Deltaproteobacteria bacterium]|nr:beta-lactamase family protein [Deltaproteobacteria bacterium]
MAADGRGAQLTGWMQSLVAEEKLAGLSVLVEQRGRVVFFETAGLRDIANDCPVERNTLFRIYSMTKPITSTAVLMLEERGLLRLSDPIGESIPALANLRVLADPAGPVAESVPATAPVTIRDLLVHTAGFIYEGHEPVPLGAAYREAGLFDNWPEVNLATWTERLGRLPLAHQPGSRFRYGVSADVLGHLVAVVSGVPFDVFLRENIFEPLGMHDTGFSVPAGALDRLGGTYGPAGAGGLELIEAAANSHFSAPPAFLSGGGGLVSTATDYLRFLQLLMGGGERDGVRLLSAENVARMTRNQLTPEQRSVDFMGGVFEACGFGYGLLAVLDSAPAALGSAGEYFWAGMASTSFSIDPAQELVVLLMAQHVPTFGFGSPLELRNLVYDAFVD